MFGKKFVRPWRRAPQQLAEKEAIIANLAAKIQSLEADMAILLESKADWERRFGKLLNLELEMQGRKKRLEELDLQIQAKEQILKTTQQATRISGALDTARQSL